MLLQTNSYIVPKEKRAEHTRLIRRFRQTLLRLGCDHFEVYEQVGSNWSNSESAGRYVQILRFLDRKHQLAVQSAERTDPTAQAVIADFCDLINFPYQQQQGLFAVGFYTSVLPVAPRRGTRGELVSTVEHEVIDDPEAEKPYPGSSDGPPIEEADPNATATSEDTFVEDPTGESGTEHEHEIDSEHVETGEPELDHPAAHPVAEHLSTAGPIPPAEVDDFLTAETIGSEPETSEIPELTLPEHSDDEFMKLVDSDLEEESADEAANGFLEEHPADESANGFIDAESAHDLKSKNRPPGW